MKFKKIKIPQAEWDKATQDKFAKWEQTNLTEEERLGLAYCRFNCWQWDDIFCPCPEGFYDLPRFSDKPGVLTREGFIDVQLEEIERTLTPAQQSMYWWKFEMNATEDEWRQWYYIDRIIENAKRKDQRKRRERRVRAVIGAVLAVGLGWAIGTMIGTFLRLLA